MARSQVASDDFSGTLANYTQLNGWGGGACTISGGALVGGGTEALTGWATVMRSAESFDSNQYAEATVLGLAFQSAGYGRAVIARCSGDVNTSGAQMDYYAAVMPDTASSGSARNCYIAKMVNGTPTTLGATVSIVFTNGDTLGIEVEGDSSSTDIRFYKNGALEFTRTDTSTPLIGGKPGLALSEVGSFDDAVFGNLGAGATTDQEAARFGEDVGTESSHAFLGASQDSPNINATLGDNFLLRVLVNATGDPASAAYTLRAQKNGAGGYLPVPVGPNVTENIGTTAYNAIATGATATNTTTHNVAYPAMTGATSKTALYLVATGRSNTADTEFAITGGGWTKLGSLEGGTGTWGTDAGTRRVTIFRKDTVTGSESGNVTVTLAGTSANTLRASIVRIEPPDQDHTIEQTFASGADTTNDTSYSATASGNQTYLAGDLLLVATAQNLDSGTLSAISLTASGVTFGTPASRASAATTGGNDHRHIVYTATVNSVSGTPNVAATWAYTISAAGSGPTAFLRIRAVRPASTNELYIANSANIAASGADATTARLDAPAGKSSVTDFVAGKRVDDANSATVDITTDGYTEIEWSLDTQAPAENGDYWDFRVYAGTTPLTTYTVTPRVTMGAAPTPKSAPPPRRIASRKLFSF